MAGNGHRWIALGYLPCILADRGALCTAIFKEITTCAWTDLYMFFTALGWVFFFGKTPAASFGYLKVMFGFGGGDVVGIMGRYLFLGNVFVLVVAFLASTPLPNLIWKKILVFGKKDKKKRIKTSGERQKCSICIRSRDHDPVSCECDRSRKDIFQRDGERYPGETGYSSWKTGREWCVPRKEPVSSGGY